MTQTEQRCGAEIRNERGDLAYRVCSLPIRQREDGEWEHVAQVLDGLTNAGLVKYAYVADERGLGHAPVPQQESAG